MTYAIGVLASLIGLVPFVWLFGLAARGRSGVAWWWLAGAFAVSWIADMVSLALSPSDRWIISLAYPVSQVALIGAVFLDRRDAAVLLGAVSFAAIASILWRGVSGPDVLVYTVSHLAVAGIVFDRPALGTLRHALLVYFGLGWMAWLAYVLHPGWPSWGMYQAVRAIGVGLFCGAALHPVPTLRLSRAE